MANWFHDPANTTGYASDNNSGSNYTAPVTFANGVTNGTTTFADTTNTPFTAGMVGQYVNILTKAAYKIVTFTDSGHVVLSGSPSSGSGLTYYIGGPKLSLSQFATANGLAAGDNIRLAKSPDTAQVQDTSANNLTGSFTNKSSTITITATSGSVTLDIDKANSGWTAATNVTASTSTTRKLGSTAVLLTTNSSFTSAAQIGYKATGTLDLSPYTKVCFWIQSNAAAASGVLQVKLCSDTAGATPVHTINVSALQANTWYCMTFDNGGALSNSIASVALYSTASYASHAIIINNIFATNRLTLTALITKDSSKTGMTDGAYPIQSVTNSSGTSTVITDQAVSSSASITSRGYSGVTETVAVYVREVSVITVAQSNAGGVNGTSGSHVTYSGGWNFSTGSQDGFSLIGENSLTIAPWSFNQNYWDLSSLIGVRGTTALSIATTSAAVSIVGIVGGIDASFGVNLNGSQSCLLSGGTIFAIANSSSGISGVGLPVNTVHTGTIICNSNGGSGINLTTSTSIVFSPTSSITCNNNNSSGIANASNLTILCSVTCKDSGNYGVSASSLGTTFISSLTTSGNSSASTAVGAGGQIIIGNFVPSEATVVSATNDLSNAFVACNTYNSTAGDYRFWNQYGNVLTSTGVVHNTQPLSINLQPNAAATAATPLYFDIRPVAINNASTTFSGYSQHDNAAVVCGLIWPGGYVPGISSDIVSTDSGGTGVWTAVSVTGTATNNYGGFRPRLYSHAAGAGGHNSYFSEN